MGKMTDKYLFLYFESWLKNVRFEAHLETISAVVDGWPDWKKNVMGSQSRLLKGEFRSFLKKKVNKK